MNLSPSRASRRVACPGSHILEARYPQDSSTYALEGTKAHRAACEMLRSPTYPSLSGNDYTPEMIEGAELYAGFIRSQIHEASAVHIEERLHISSIHPDCWGTPDCWILQSTTEIDIYDYKFGHGFVEVYENWQLIEYAAGILEHLGINGIADTYININMYVIQPRSFHPQGQIRHWRVKASDLRPYFNTLRNAEEAATQPHPYTKPSSECNYCTARHGCPALQASAMTSVDIAGSAIPHELTPIQVSSELRILQHAAELFDARISGLSAEALALIRKGERLPHYYATRTQSRQRWNKSIEEVIMLGELYGIDLSKPGVITPKQAIAKGLKVDKYSETPLGELKLMPLDTRKTDKMFGD